MLRCLRQRMLYIVLKSETVQQIFTLSIADCIKGGVKFFVRFLCNINLCGIGHIGIGDKGMTIPIFKFRHLIQTDDLAHVLCFKGCTLTSDVVDHGIANCRSCVSQKFVAAIGIEFLHASHQSQTAFLHKIVKGNTECPIDFYLADILTVGDLEERVAVVDELMKNGKITFLQDYTTRKKKEDMRHERRNDADLAL